MIEKSPPLRLTLYPSMGPHWTTARPRDAQGFEYVRCPGVSDSVSEERLPLSPDARKTLRAALWSWAGYARERANEIAQDRDGRLRGRDGKPIPASAVGAALDEAARAERLVSLFREDPPR